ncbi:MAG: aminomethyl-transferring glycine dehydrogenase subunit GcvPA [Thermoplasmata archaeon]
MIPEKMLDVLRIKTLDELFDDIPNSARIDGLNLPDGIEDLELERDVTRILARNRTMADIPIFLGGGVYRHYVPAVVEEILSRSELYTSYTPYQAEASQGMLQALFEYQSMVAELTGLEAVNSSMYDWSTALGEAALMCHRIKPGKRFLIGRSVSPERKAVLKTYLAGIGASIKEIPFEKESGRIDLQGLKSEISDDVFGLYLENPNYFGVLEEDVDEVSPLIRDVPLVIGANPLSLAILKPPSEYGADIVIGEGHHLGTNPNFGGPLLGIFATKKEHIRKMPGRIIGMTVDATGKTAYCMTLQTREQHIRRDKATSNICTNEALMAVAAVAYLASIGKRKLVEIASENIRKAKKFADRISSVKGFRAPLFQANHFNEFVMRSDTGAEELSKRLLSKGVHGGICLNKDFPDLGESMLLAVSELHSDEDFDLFVSALEGEN